jgi:hypothetical protein
MELDGVPVRRWDGVLDSGASVIVFVHRLASADPRAHAELEAADHPEFEAPQQIAPVATSQDGGMVQLGLALAHELSAPQFADVLAALVADRDLARQVGLLTANLGLRIAGDAQRTPELDAVMLARLVATVCEMARLQVSWPKRVS